MIFLERYIFYLGNIFYLEKPEKYRPIILHAIVSGCTILIEMFRIKIDYNFFYV